MTLFRHSIDLTSQVIKKQWWGLLLLFIAGTWVGIQLEDQLAIVSTRDDQWRIALGLAGGVSDLIEGFILLFLLSWAIPRIRRLSHPAFLNDPFNRAYISTFFAEYLRVLGRVLLWGLLIIVPGFVRYIQLTFVPFIVFFSRKYEDGEVDALQLSTQLVNRRWKWVYPIMVFSIVASILLQLAPNHFVELHTTPIRVLFYLGGTLLSIWTYCLMFLLFEQELTQ